MVTEQKLPYINTIRIWGLLGNKAFTWKLTPGINILSGVNGSGKSSVLQAISTLLRQGYYQPNHLKPIKGIEVLFEDGGILPAKESIGNTIYTNVDTVSTFDTSLKNSEALRKLTDNNINSELDWELYNIISKYLRHQVKVGQMAVTALLKNKDPETIRQMAQRHDLFISMLNTFFLGSGKEVEREREDTIMFRLGDKLLTPYQLSSGEKQLIVILTTVFCQDSQPSIMLMDEPEISLHFEWQKKLIDAIVKLNPNLQLIVTTHSPAMIMEGWLDKVTDIDDILVK